MRTFLLITERAEAMSRTHMELGSWIPFNFREREKETRRQRRRNKEKKDK